MSRAIYTNKNISIFEKNILPDRLMDAIFLMWELVKRRETAARL